MKLSSEELDHVAHLARVDVPAEEKEAFRGQIAAVLSYVASLQQLDMTGVNPTFRGTDLGQRLRPDAVEHCEPEQRAQLVTAAPEKSGPYIKAQAALKHKQG